MKNVFGTESYDITLIRPSRFRPFLNWRHLKLIGMTLFAMSQIVTLSKVGNFVYEDFLKINETLAEFLKGISAISLPLMMIVVFSRIITDEEHIRRRVYLYFCLAFGFYILEIVAVHAYIYYTVAGVIPDAEILAVFTEALIRSCLAPFAGINVFLDFFVCSLFYYFLISRPKDLFGARLVLFRLGTLLPVFYILLSVVLHGLFSLGILELDFYTVALLPSKNLSVYLLFFAAVLYRRHFTRRGNVFRADSFSVFLALVLSVISAADYLLAFLPDADAFGIGDASTFFLAVPIVLCYDCEKPLKNRLAPIIYDPIFYLVLYGGLFYYYSEICNLVISAFYGMFG